MVIESGVIIFIGLLLLFIKLPRLFDVTDVFAQSIRTSLHFMIARARVLVEAVGAGDLALRGRSDSWYQRRKACRVSG